MGVLHEKEGSTFNADFVAEVIKEWRWITYPWAMVEDMKEFLGKVTIPSFDRRCTALSQIKL